MKLEPMIVAQVFAEPTEDSSMNENLEINKSNKGDEIFNNFRDKYVDDDENNKKVNRSNPLPKADVIGEELADEFKTKLLYNLESNTFLFSESEQKGVWAVSQEESIESLRFQKLRQKGISG
ncbi:hypothetical protein [Microseira sp. BLCC-F43]|jgi:hypothetical protein|uniref:hypothetical protein n=1 Tax=Microseira sp. BLCC-F43 TaxID=3153602 RepID=UPI0035B95337